METGLGDRSRLFQMPEQLTLDLGIQEDDLQERILQHRSEVTGVDIEIIREVEEHHQRIRELNPYKPRKPKHRKIDFYNYFGER